MERKQKISVALRKAKTSIETLLEEMNRKESACFPAIQQNLAVIGLLKSVNLLLLEGAIEHATKQFEKSSSRTLRDEILHIVRTAQDK